MVESYQILAAAMPENDAKAVTIKDYLIALLDKLWEEEEGFSGKRPFGNSGWKSDLYVALIAARLVDGELDENGDIERVDEKWADRIIATAIRSL